MALPSIAENKSSKNSRTVYENCEFGNGEGKKKGHFKNNSSQLINRKIANSGKEESSSQNQSQSQRQKLATHEISLKTFHESSHYNNNGKKEVG